MWGSRSMARYQATPPISSASVTRSITESKNAPRWLAEFDALAKRPVEQVREGGQHHEEQPSPQGAGADGDRGGHAEQEPEDR